LSLTSSWSVLTTSEYEQASAEFRRSAEALHRAALEKGIDGAALAYVDMTLKCVQCHKYLRGARRASNPEDGEGGSRR
jgi:hypothetical protein